jgi:hypothetical protein
MELRDLLRSLGYVAILLVLVLQGCATKPVSEVSEPAGQQVIPSSGKLLDFSAKRFSIESPPVNWEKVTEKYPPSVAAWQNRDTRSIIQIYAHPPCRISYRGQAEILMNAVMVAMREKDPQAVLAVTEEKEVVINGKTFYQIHADCEMSPVKGVQAKHKLLYYLLRGEKMTYYIALIALLAYNEQDIPILDQMVRSFTCF